MANTNILQLPIATGLTGAEYVPIVQAGVDKRATTAQIGNAADGWLPNTTRLNTSNGITGGGLLDTDLTLMMDVAGMTSVTAMAIADAFPINSVSAGNAPRKVTFPNAMKAISGLTDAGALNLSSDKFVVVKASDGNTYSTTASQISLAAGNVPAGGTTGQALIKVSGTNYDTTWSAIGNVPAGGTTGQALVKVSGTNYDTTWSAIGGVPAGGTTGQALVKVSGTDYDTTWSAIGVTGGGTGQASLTNHGVLVGAGTSAITQLAAAALGTVLAGGGTSADPAFSATPTLGIAGTTLGTLSLAGNTSGTATIRPQATAGTPTLTLPNASGTFAVSATSPLALNATTGALTIAGSALTKVDDTNVTLTLGGTPTTALLAAASLTLGWTGQLSIARGGTGQATASAAFDALSPTTTRGDLIYRNATTNTRLAASTSGYLLQTNGASTDPTWVGFLQSGTGAVTRTWQNKARDILTIVDFGAVGDGSTDDTTAIQNAVNAATGVVLVPPGNYKISSTITIGATGIRLVGDAGESLHDVGSQTGPVKFSWYGAAGGTMVSFASPTGVTAQIKSDMGCRGIMLDGRRIAGYGYKFQSIRKSFFENLFVLDVTTSAYYSVCGVTGVDYGESADVQDCIWRSCQWRLIDVASVQSANGFRVDGSSNANTSFNKFFNCLGQTYNGMGWLLVNSDNNVFDQCRNITVSGTGKDFYLNGVSVSSVGAQNNTFNLCSWGSGVGAFTIAGTDSGFTAGTTNNIITAVDTINGYSQPLLGTGSSYISNMLGTVLAVKGTATNSSNIVRDIVANTDGHVLRRSGTTVGFGLASLTSGVTGTLPIANGGTNNATAYAAGSVIYADGTKLTESNTGLFFNASNIRLGVGTQGPTNTLSLRATTAGQDGIYLEVANATNVGPYLLTYHNTSGTAAVSWEQRHDFKNASAVEKVGGRIRLRINNNVAGSEDTQWEFTGQHNNAEVDYFYASNSGMQIATGGLGIGNAPSSTAWQKIAAGTTAKSQINFVPSTAPTSPNDGDFWYDGTNVKIRVGGTTKTFTLT